MSSLRHCVHHRVHLERSQPADRSKWGLLEKRSDWQLRAKDYKQKQTVLKKLTKAAEERNVDEFSFKMLNAKLVDGKLIKRDKELTPAEIKQKELIELCDRNYIEWKCVHDEKTVAKLKESSFDLSSSPPESISSSAPQHVIFDDDGRPTVVAKAEEDFLLSPSAKIVGVAGLRKRDVKKFGLLGCLDADDIVKADRKRRAENIVTSKTVAELQKRKQELKSALNEIDYSRVAKVKKGKEVKGADGKSKYLKSYFERKR